MLVVKLFFLPSEGGVLMKRRLSCCWSQSLTHLPLQHDQRTSLLLSHTHSLRSRRQYLLYFCDFFKAEKHGRLSIETCRSENQGDLVSVNIFKGIFRSEHDPIKLTSHKTRQKKMHISVFFHKACAFINQIIFQLTHTDTFKCRLLLMKRTVLVGNTIPIWVKVNNIIFDITRYLTWLYCGQNICQTSQQQWGFIL